MNKQKKNESIYKRMILLFLLITGVGGCIYDGYYTISAFEPYSSMNYQYQMAYAIIYH